MIKRVKDFRLISINPKDERQIKILNNLGIITPNNNTVFRDIINRVEEVYPDSWDLQLNFDKNYMLYDVRLEIVIKFPELTITNSLELKHSIYDLYISVPIKLTDKFELKRLHGTRGKATREEISNKYLHSHLPGNNYNTKDYGFSKFCVGDGEILQTELMLNVEYDSNRFKLYLFQLRSYAEWESIEGTPYNYITNVLNGGTGMTEFVISDITNVSTYIRDSMSYGFQNSIYLLYKEINLAINSKSEIVIVDDRNFEDFVVALYESLPNYNQLYILVKNQEGMFRQANSIPIRYSGDSLVGKFPFKGKMNNVEIVESQPILAENYLKYLHPKLKLIIKNYFENEFNKTAIKLTAFR